MRVSLADSSNVSVSPPSTCPRYTQVWAELLYKSSKVNRLTQRNQSYITHA